MLNHIELQSDLNSSLCQAEIATKKSDILKHLRFARTYAGALDHPKTESLTEKIHEIEKIKGRIVSEDLREIRAFCKSLKV